MTDEKKLTPEQRQEEHVETISQDDSGKIQTSNDNLRNTPADGISRKLWRTSLTVSVILLVVFSVYEIVIGCLYGKILTQGTPSVSAALTIASLAFGGAAALLSLIMTVLSAVVYGKTAVSVKKDNNDNSDTSSNSDK